MPFEVTRPIEQLKAEAVARVNAQAGQIILARLPQWKQSNLTARAVELQSIGPAQWGVDEQAEWDYIQSEWDWVKSIRAESNAAVEAINAANHMAEIRAIEAEAFA
ncbi:hypothetical protein [Methylomicrobium agile]|uniref:hypothetical protein n=1 Tax=Methylomicrobium agile TaxID=39774 RepID=UPI0004DFAF6D|nr:hypothetical protein [Methylomicrobium agile]